MARMSGNSARAVVLPGLEESGISRLVEFGKRLFLAWFSVILVLVAWETFARSGAVTTFLLPPFTMVVERVWADLVSGDLVLNLGRTLYRALFGFTVASCLGVTIGILMARNAAFRWFFDPIVSVGFPMPKIGFLPIFMLWFGLYDTSKIALIIFDASFPVITATYAATLGVERYTIWSARMLGSGERNLLWEIILPAAFPGIMTGLQIALPISLIIAIVTEMIMGGPGLGGAMIAASRFADSPGVFAGILEIAVAGYFVVRGMAYLRRRLLVWHQEAEDPTTV
jgi:ABC-type nitrate/sulfonate/bicarbonate transport system permease component